MLSRQFFHVLHNASPIVKTIPALSLRYAIHSTYLSHRYYQRNSDNRGPFNSNRTRQQNTSSSSSNYSQNSYNGRRYDNDSNVNGKDEFTNNQTRSTGSSYSRRTDSRRTDETSESSKYNGRGNENGSWNNTNRYSNKGYDNKSRDTKSYDNSNRGMGRNYDNSTRDTRSHNNETSYSSSHSPSSSSSHTPPPDQEDKEYTKRKKSQYLNQQPKPQKPKGEVANFDEYLKSKQRKEKEQQVKRETRRNRRQAITRSIRRKLEGISPEEYDHYKSNMIRKTANKLQAKLEQEEREAEALYATKYRGVPLHQIPISALPHITFARMGVAPHVWPALHNQGLTHPTSVQLAAIPHLLPIRTYEESFKAPITYRDTVTYPSLFDTLIQDMTGSGKTLAYLIPTLQSIQPRSPTLQAIVVCPTRELTIQAALVASKLAKGSKNADGEIIIGRVNGRIKDFAIQAIRKNPPHILFTTPQTLDYLITNQLSSEKAEADGQAQLSSLKKHTTAKDGKGVKDAKDDEAKKGWKGRHNEEEDYIQLRGVYEERYLRARTPAQKAEIIREAQEDEKKRRSKQPSSRSSSRDQKQQELSKTFSKATPNGDVVNDDDVNDDANSTNTLHVDEEGEEFDENVDAEDVKKVDMNIIEGIDDVEVDSSLYHENENEDIDNIQQGEYEIVGKDGENHDGGIGNSNDTDVSRKPQSIINNSILDKKFNVRHPHHHTKYLQIQSRVKNNLTGIPLLHVRHFIVDEADYCTSSTIWPVMRTVIMYMRAIRDHQFTTGFRYLPQPNRLYPYKALPLRMSFVTATMTHSLIRVVANAFYKPHLITAANMSANRQHLTKNYAMSAIPIFSQNSSLTHKTSSVDDSYSGNHPSTTTTTEENDIEEIDFEFETVLDGYVSNTSFSNNNPDVDATNVVDTDNSMNLSRNQFELLLAGTKKKRTTSFDTLQNRDLSHAIIKALQMQRTRVLPETIRHYITTLAVPQHQHESQYNTKKRIPPLCYNQNLASYTQTVVSMSQNPTYLSNDANFDISPSKDALLHAKLHPKEYIIISGKDRKDQHDLIYKINTQKDSLVGLTKLYSNTISRIFSASKPRTMIVFLNNSSHLEELAVCLEQKNLKVGVLTTESDKTYRRSLLLKLNTQKLHIILTTNMMARGIDTAGAGCVLNLGLPPDPWWYIHRAGRVDRMRSKSQGNAVINISFDIYNSNTTKRMEDVSVDIVENVAVDAATESMAAEKEVMKTETETDDVPKKSVVSLLDTKKIQFVNHKDERYKKVNLSSEASSYLRDVQRLSAINFLPVELLQGKLYLAGTEHVVESRFNRSVQYLHDTITSTDADEQLEENMESDNEFDENNEEEHDIKMNNKRQKNRNLTAPMHSFQVQQPYLDNGFIEYRENDEYLKIVEEDNTIQQDLEDARNRKREKNELKQQLLLQKKLELEKSQLLQDSILQKLEDERSLANLDIDDFVNDDISILSRQSDNTIEIQEGQSELSEQHEQHEDIQSMLDAIDAHEKHQGVDLSTFDDDELDLIREAQKYDLSRYKNAMQSIDQKGRKSTDSNAFSDIEDYESDENDIENRKMNFHAEMGDYGMSDREYSDEFSTSEVDMQQRLDDEPYSSLSDYEFSSSDNDRDVNVDEDEDEDVIDDDITRRFGKVIRGTCDNENSQNFKNTIEVKQIQILSAKELLENAYQLKRSESGIVKLPKDFDFTAIMRPKTVEKLSISSTHDEDPIKKQDNSKQRMMGFTAPNVVFHRLDSDLIDNVEYDDILGK